MPVRKPMPRPAPPLPSSIVLAIVAACAYAAPATTQAAALIPHVRTAETADAGVRQGCCRGAAAGAAAPAPTFGIRNDRFLRNGVPVQIISSSVHYFRIRPELWGDRLLRAKSLGVNAIDTYVPWNLHEPSKGQFRFGGGADLLSFLRLAHSLGLMVLLRPGPYICAEWDLGGFPPWLLAEDPPLLLRSQDPRFLAHVDTWWDELLPLVQPLLWRNGGPIVMVQVENEYGYYKSALAERVNTTAYLSHLVTKLRAVLGDDVVLYTTDLADANVLRKGTLPPEWRVLAAVDAFIGPKYSWRKAFALQKLFNAPGLSPPFVSEFYTGWFTTWRAPVQRGQAASLVASQLRQILSLNGSVSFYMGVGGTSFGGSSGANTQRRRTSENFQPQVTSYDYAAPIGEAGDLNTPLYNALRQEISSHLQAPLPVAPPLPARKALAQVALTGSARLLDTAVLAAISAPVQVPVPTSMERLNQSSGLILYSAALPRGVKPSDKLIIFGVKDRAHVFVSNSSTTGAGVRRLLGKVERWRPNLWLAVGGDSTLRLVQVLVEHMGRVNFGPYIGGEAKGITAVRLEQSSLAPWTVHPIPLSSASLAAVPFKTLKGLPPGPFEPTFFRGTFSVAAPVDTFLSLRGWGKGYAFVNGFNLGRYWPSAGPQCHLYIPLSLLRKGPNVLVLLELDSAPSVPSVSFTNSTDFSCPPRGA